MAGKRRAWAVLLLLAEPLCGGLAAAQATGNLTIPPTRTVAFDGHPVTLPKDLTEPATVLILGFGRDSKTATTAWEQAVRTQLVHPGAVGLYELAMLAEVPGFVRPLVLRKIKREVPGLLQGQFLSVTEDEEAWKRAAGYAADQPQAAYVLLVDRGGRVQWATHAPFSAESFADLRHKALAVAGRRP